MVLQKYKIDVPNIGTIVFNIYYTWAIFTNY